ncbi:ficolin-2-like [Physella acuta]|uniref:ficolin-2-like n=1 Tax=Physella acuta TaxID=109671 RepID=UPI0027DD6263|nr:ficolin-2-like [Physella acuta]
MDYFTWWLTIAVCFFLFNCSYADNTSENKYTKKAGTGRCKNRPQKCRSTFGQQTPKCEKSAMIACLKDRAVFESLDSRLVLCDTKSDGGGWILIQRNMIGDVTFNKTWEEFRDGFGSLDGDFWLGNDMISKLTAEGYTDLRIDMKWKGQNKYFTYKNFTVQGEADLYRMSYTAGSIRGSTDDDHFRTNNGNPFTTIDKGPSYGCIPIGYKGWWWPNDGTCGFTNLNGERGNRGYGLGIYWYYYTGANDSLDSAEMKLRKPNP